jgi:hypothetical protein
MIGDDATTALIPLPADVHRRLGEIARERALLRRLLRLALAAHAEEARRPAPAPVQGGEGSCQS